MTDSNQVTKTENAQPVQRRAPRPVFSPPVDIIETSEKIILRADIPGADEKNIDCTLERGVLTIRAKAEDQTPQEMRLLDGEFVPGDYQRVFSLSEEIDQEKIRASVKNGVLELQLPKAGHAKPRKIEIQSE